MKEILYTGMHETTLALIKPHLVLKKLQLNEFIDLNFSHYQGTEETLLVGEDVENPIKLAQLAHAKDKLLSIVIIKEQWNYQKFKQALLFTPFIGLNILCVSNENGVSLALLIEELANKTEKRRKFERIKITDIKIVSNPVLERLKRQYVDRFFEQAPIGAILLDKNGKILATNMQMISLLHRSEDKILGVFFPDLFSATEKERLQQFLSVETDYSAKLIFRSLEKDIQYLEITVTTLKNFEEYKSILVNDVTERELSRQRIEEQVEELKVSNEDLRRVNVDLDNFIYTASHDLKSPISNLEGLLHVFQSEIFLDEAHKKIMEMMFSSIERFKTTIKDLAEVTYALQENEDNQSMLCLDDILAEVLLDIEKEIESKKAVLKKDFQVNNLRFPRKT